MQRKNGWINNAQELNSWILSKELKNLHSVVKNLLGGNSCSCGGNIKDRNSNLLFEKQDILVRWKEYVAELFEDNQSPEPQKWLTALVHP